MPARLNPYISFSGDARAAMEYYREVLGGELTMSTYGEFGQAGTPIADRIMHAQLETPSGFTLMGADSPPGVERADGSAIAISLSGDDEAELRGYWDGLSSGGTVTVPLEQQMWGDLFGQCTDRFGVDWMVNIATHQG